jgi:N-acetylmuramoyl-L-alanine amidase
MIFLTAGHHRKDAGATYNGRKEADETIRLRNAITTVLKSKGISVWNDNDEWDLNRTISEIKKLSNPDDIICDLHFNAGSSSATGCEVYIPENADSVEQNMARKLAAIVSSTLIIKNRGVKSESSSQHKRLGMMRPTGKNLLLETCFISSKYDMVQYDIYFVFLVEKIADVLIGQ